MAFLRRQFGFWAVIGLAMLDSITMAEFVVNARLPDCVRWLQ